jgi:hypothetical protein
MSNIKRNYWTFESKDELIFPFEYVRTLSNGVVVGKCYDDQEYGVSLEQITEYIKNNHVEDIEE